MSLYVTEGWPSCVLRLSGVITHYDPTLDTGEESTVLVQSDLLPRFYSLECLIQTWLF